MEAITKIWYDYLEEGKMMGLKCKKCGAVHFPPYPICRDCSGIDMEWVPISGEGIISEIALVNYPDPWAAQYAPYYFGYAAIKEGSWFESMLFGLEGTPEEVFEKYVPLLPIKAKLEIQKRDGYSYPVYRYTPE